MSLLKSLLEDTLHTRYLQEQQDKDKEISILRTEENAVPLKIIIEYKKTNIITISLTMARAKKLKHSQFHRIINYTKYSDKVPTY